jgi:hypothetical protein
MLLHYYKQSLDITADVTLLIGTISSTTFLGCSVVRDAPRASKSMARGRHKNPFHLHEIKPYWLHKM